MGNVLIVSKTQESTAPLAELLKCEGYTSLETAVSTLEVKNLLAKQEYDLAIINTPISDSNGLDLAVYIADNTKAGVILLIKAEALQKVSTVLTQKGVFCLPKPLNKQLFCTAITMWQAAKKRLIGLEEENTKLKTKVEDIKLIHRAKCILMECLNMTEPQAHRYLEKQAMDMRESKRRIAEQVLNTYEN